MKQVLQSLKTGTTELTEIPQPILQPNSVLIRTKYTLVSTGTEKMLVEFGKSSWLNKARKSPDKVRMVFDKIRTDGLFATMEAVRTKLDKLMPMGYCNVGVVTAVSDDVTEFQVGDRVVSNGPHAEMVVVEKNLCCKIPDGVKDEHAAFTILGAIALQGIRLSQPTLGETFVVMGLGVIGLLTMQLLRAQGCRVVGFDINSYRVKVADELGHTALAIDKSDNSMRFIEQFTRHRGCDGVIITAATDSNDPIHQAAEMCRKRGRIVLVGTAGLNLSRADFYEKELSFQVSCSYGPGRYDPQYEDEGIDYPLGFVRWTAQRNFEAFLDMLSAKAFDVNTLITHRFVIEDAEEAYDLLTQSSPSLGILISYPVPKKKTNAFTHTVALRSVVTPTDANVRVGFIGAGNYASRILIPTFKKSGADLRAIACASGVSGTQVGKRFKFIEVTTDTNSMIQNAELNTIVIASRHDTHADFVCSSLAAKKHVYVEKPLCLTLAELDRIAISVKDSSCLLMVGFNRRFAPHVLKIKNLLSEITDPKVFIMTVNAGDIPIDHWTQDKNIGGGRIIGEVCHFIDLLRYLSASPINDFNITRMNYVPIRDDKVTITLTFEDGSTGTIHYLANGHRSFPKERLEIFTGGKILQLDNYRLMRGFGFTKFNSMKLWRQDKGQTACVKQFMEAIVRGKSSPIPIAEILEVAKVTLEIAKAPC